MKAVNDTYVPISLQMITKIIRVQPTAPIAR